MSGRELFERVVAMTGVSPTLARGIVRRTLIDEGVQPEHAQAEHYEKALPRLRARIAAYLSIEEAQRRVELLHQILDDATVEPAAGAGEAVSSRSAVAPSGVVPAVNGRSGGRSPAEQARREEMMRTGERVKEGVELPPGRRTVNGG